MSSGIAARSVPFSPAAVLTHAQIPLLSGLIPRPNHLLYGYHFLRLLRRWCRRPAKEDW